MIVNTVYNTYAFPIVQIVRYPFKGYVHDLPYVIYNKLNGFFYAKFWLFNWSSNAMITNYFMYSGKHVPVVPPLSDYQEKFINFESNLLNRYGISYHHAPPIAGAYYPIPLFDSLVLHYDMVLPSGAIRSPEHVEFFNKIIQDRPFRIFDYEGFEVPYSLNYNVDGFTIVVHNPPKLNGYRHYRDLLPNSQKDWLDIHFDKDGFVYDSLLANFIEPIISDNNYSRIHNERVPIPVISRQRLLNTNPLTGYNPSKYPTVYSSFAFNYIGVWGDQRHKEYLEKNKEKIREVFY